MGIPVTAQARYKMLATEREPYLLRGRRNSELTLPSLLPPEGTNAATNLYDPYQSVGSKGVNHLASKLMLALFPPNTPFFRLRLDEKVKAQAEQSGDPEALTDIET
ncbi:MAG: hypothetical protein GWN39_00755, partial [Thermoplasmata archaeon]|nr:hypothetical protein [Thermoplasmata archaeon]NIT75472.1 hypothetical protein [Thermoplasmata archaeon]NIV77297.1 hypothetical protein [Thermoplasmata archaeon]NIY01843.1 hypothetical protein [Thermoplasmata archaeon]